MYSQVPNVCNIDNRHKKMISLLYKEIQYIKNKREMTLSLKGKEYNWAVSQKKHKLPIIFLKVIYTGNQKNHTFT